MTRRLPITRLCASACALLAVVSGPALALDPSQVFDKVSPSVWVVKTWDAGQRPVGLGSAVVVAHGKLVTNCHVLVKAKYVHVRRKNVSYEASLEAADVRRDLCLLKVDNFDAPPVSIRSRGDLKVGERVFAIGNPEGLEVTLSDGLISGLRPMTGQLVKQGVDEVIQTTAPISPGSSGGGLFDAQGRLVGITTLYSLFAQNLNIALPADWIAEIPARAKAALARRVAKSRAAAGAPGMPAPGTSWTYGFVERVYGRQEVDITVRAVRVDGTVVEEQVTSSAPGAKDTRRVVNASESRFFDFPLDSDNDLIEMSPYLLAANDGEAPEDVPDAQGYPRGGAGYPDFVATVTPHGWEQVTVPAGTFRALRVTVAGRRSTNFHTRASATGKFEMTIWYAPDVKRFVKMVQKIWSADAFKHVLDAEDVVELRSYRPPS